MNIRSIIPGLAMALTAISMPAVAQAAEGFVSSSGNLRAGPQTDYPRIDHLARGTSLEVYGCLQSYAWCDVSADGERGWFPGSRIQFLRDGRNLNLVTSFGILGLSVLDFAQPDYWNSHYSNQPWYGDKRWQHGNDAQGRGLNPGFAPNPGRQPTPGRAPVQGNNPGQFGHAPAPQQNNIPAAPAGGGNHGNFHAAPAQQQPARQNQQPQGTQPHMQNQQPQQHQNAPQQQHQNAPQQHQKACPAGEAC